MSRAQPRIAMHALAFLSLSIAPADGAARSAPAAAQVASPAEVSPALPEAVPEVTHGFAGLWSTSYGMLRLVQDGVSLRGTYDFAGGSTVVGSLAQGRLAFGYAQPDGEVGVGGFTLAADGLSFEGTWRSDAGAEGRWSGQRVLPMPGRSWLVILEAHWEESLGAPEYSYGEMLRAFFSRLPDVEVRHRFVHDVADLERFCREAAYLAEPVVLYVSSHGTEAGVSLGTDTAGAEALNRALHDVAELRLLHFGSCLVLNGDVPRAIDAARPAHARFPISGFTRSADWAGSAIVDFTYLELVLGRGLPPREALDWTRRMVSFAREDADEPIHGSGLALHEPAAEPAAVGR